MTGPGENPYGKEWSKEAVQFFGPQFIQQVESGTAIFAPYLLEEIERDPSLAIELERRAKPFEDRAIEIGTKRFLAAIFNRHNRCKKEPFSVFVRMDMLIASAYPEWLGGTRSENVFLNPVLNEIKSQAIARLAKWRHKNNKQGRPEVALYEVLGTRNDLDHYQHLMQTHPEIVRSLGSYFEFLRIEEFFQKNGIDVKDDEKNIPVAERQRINDTIARIISEHRQYGTPLSISDNENLAAEKTHIQLEDVGPHTPEYGACTARAILYDKNDGLMVKDAPKLLEVTQPAHSSELFMSMSALINNSISFFISRDTGELYGYNAGSKGIKFFLGREKYELLRTHLLLHLAELTCEGDKFREALSAIIEMPTPQPSTPRGQGTGTRRRGPKKVLPERYFPRSARPQNMNPNEESIERGTVRLHEVAYHVRLLPFGHRPSLRALELARDHDQSLGAAVQTSAGNIIPYETIVENSARMGISTQEYIELAEAVIRYETFVKRHERGDSEEDLTEHNRLLAVQAKSKAGTIGMVEAALRRNRT